MKEKIIAEIHRLKRELEGYSAREALDYIESYINTLASLPSNLDEAAQRIAYDVCKQLPNGEEKDGIVYYAILAAIAGAEWMAGQGETAIVKVDVNGMNTPIIYLWDDKWKKYSGDEVVVQIRKK